jgi:propionyl-CoA carboxylase beta chain
MNSKHIGADMILLGQPEIAVMGAKGASEIIFKKEINEAKIMKQSWRKKGMLSCLQSVYCCAMDL